MTIEELYTKYRNTHAKISPLAMLDQVNWSSLSHAHGDASDFPILVYAAISDDKHDREFALKLLHETIWHQGTLYPATAFALPFIIALVQSPEITNQVDFALLFATIAQASSLDIQTSQVEAGISVGEENQYDRERSKENNWMETIKNTVEKYLHVLHPFLLHENRSTREEIAETLSCFPNLR